jgi:hypothetical protein
VCVSEAFGIDFKLVEVLNLYIFISLFQYCMI